MNKINSIVRQVNHQVWSLLRPQISIQVNTKVRSIMLVQVYNQITNQIYNKIENRTWNKFRENNL